MDLLSVTAVTRELAAALVGSVLSRVVQIAPEALVLEWWGGAQRTPRLRAAGRRLVVAVEAEAPRLHLTSLPPSRLRARPPSPGGPPRFCAYLRAHAEGMRLLEIVQPPGERVVTLRLGRAGERLDLVVELLGSQAQLVAVGGDGRVRSALRRASGAGGRRLAPGSLYVPPPAGRARPLADLPLVVREALPVEAAGLAREVAGLTRPLAAHLLAAAQGGGGAVDPDRLAAAARDLVERTETGRFEPRIYRPADSRAAALAAGHPAADRAAAGRDEAPGGARLAAPLLAMVPLAHLEPEPGRPVPGVAVERFESPSAAVEAFYAGPAHGLGRRAGLLGARLLAARERRRRRLAALAADRVRLERDADARRLGDLLAAQRSLLRKGQREVQVVDLFDPAAPAVTIPLDPALDPQGNIDACYARARRAQRGLGTVAARQAETEAELARLEEALRTLEAAETPADLAALEAELSEQGLLPAPREAAGRRTEASTPPLRRFRSSDGLEIVVGRSNSANDYLSTRLARPDDLWLHAEGYPGAHVLVRRGSGAPAVPERTLLEAAQLAALYSRARGAGKVAVQVAPASAVRKPPGAKAGLVVLIGGHRSIVVAPDPDLPARLAGPAARVPPRNG